MGRYRRKREAKARRRPWEFSKKLAAWAVLVATAAAVASYVLAFRDQQTAADGNPISGAGVGEYTTTTTSDKEAKG